MKRRDERPTPSAAHRLLLGLHPRGFLDDFGGAMEETLARRAAEARRRGGAARVRFWWRESAGLAVSALGEQLRAAGLWQRSHRAHDTRREIPMLEFMARESRHAARRLVRSPAFTAAAVMTLALAIGANAAIFTVVERVVLSPLPYADAGRIVYLDHGARGLDRLSGLGLTTGLYWQYARRARTVEDVVLYQNIELTVTGDEGPSNVQVTRTTPSFARALGVAPFLGRWFDDVEGAPGGRPVAVLSYGTWQRRFGGDPAVLGRTVPFSGTAAEVIGVMPRGFAFPEPTTELWVPHQLDATNVRVGAFNFSGIARLAEGATLSEARAELDRLIAQIPQDFPGDESAVPIVEQAGTFSNVMPLKERVVGPTRRTLWILLGAVGVVLLVACANVANLFLVRAEGRQREVAVRQALGAGRGGVAGFYFGETLLLALAGGALGLLLAVGAVKLLVAYGPADLPRLHEVRVDAAVLLFTLVVSMLAAVALGAVPLLRASGALAPALHETGRGNTATVLRMRARNLLMGAQVALALVLLVASGLLAKSFQRMRAVNPGYTTENALVLRPGHLHTNDYPTRETAVAFHERVLERVRALPGVTGAAATTCPPLSSYCHGDPVSLPGRPWSEGDMPPIASFRRVGDGFFSLLGIRLIRGRLFDERDQQVPTHAVVIDERMAELYFPGEDALGKLILHGQDGEVIGSETEPPRETPYEVVGIVNHVLTWGVASADRPPQVYLPLLSHTGYGTPTVNDIAYIVRTAGTPIDLVPSIRRVLAGLDSTVPLALTTTLEAMLEEDRAPAAFTMTLIAIASVVALLLGLIGIYGVISYVVAQRSAEIGVRLALGARPADVAGMILKQGAGVALAGLVVGLIAAAAGSRVLHAILFDVSATDPATYALVTAALLAVSLLACWLPARRAARLDPAEALRN